jgi:hypothetical protein
MSLTPTHIQQIDAAIQAGRGAAASVLGQTYDVYRLLNTSNNTIVTGTPYLTNYVARIRRKDGTPIENEKFKLLTFSAICDNRNLDIGDVLVENGYRTDDGTYCIAEMRPTRETILVRTESMATITRPNPHAGQAGQMPISGFTWIDSGRWGGTDKANELILTLTNGTYSFQQTGTYASVPVGLQPWTRIRNKDKGMAEMPTQAQDTEWFIYVPLLPGMVFVENDIINYQNGDRYMVIQPYVSTVGLQGWILVVAKMAV